MRSVDYSDKWHDVVFAANWSNIGLGFQACQYRKLPNGTVQLRGTAVAAAGAGFQMFTLPVGYRPAAIIGPIVNAGATPAAAGRLTIDAVGGVFSPTNVAGQFCILDSVNFYGEPSP